MLVDQRNKIQVDRSNPSAQDRTVCRTVRACPQSADSNSSC